MLSTVPAEVTSLVAELVECVESQQECESGEVLTLQSMSVTEKREFVQGEIRALGEVLHFTEGKLVVRSYPSAPLLNLGSPVCGEDHMLIGVVDDVLGSVKNPHFSIDAYHRLPDGTTIFYPVETAKYLQNVTHRPGTDASTVNDMEAADSSGSDVEAPPQPVKRTFLIFERPPQDLE